MNWHQLKQGLQISHSFKTSQKCWCSLHIHAVDLDLQRHHSSYSFWNNPNPSLWFFKLCWFRLLLHLPWLCWLLTISDISKSMDFRQDLEVCTGNTHPILLSMRLLGIMASIALREFASFSSVICFGIPRIYSNPLFGIWSEKQYLPWVTNMHLVQHHLHRTLRNLRTSHHYNIFFTILTIVF